MLDHRRGLAGRGLPELLASGADLGAFALQAGVVGAGPCPAVARGGLQVLSFSGVSQA